MNLDQFTTATQAALSQAVTLASSNSSTEVTSIHLLLTLLAEPDRLIVEIMTSLRLPVSEIESEATSDLKSGPKVSTSTPPRISSDLQRVLVAAQRVANQLGDTYISREHLLLAMTDVECQTFRILKKYAINREKLLEAIKKARGNQKVDSADAENKYNVLEKYTINLTRLARAGKLDPVIGRDEEIRRVMQILSRRTKNNPVLIGDPGVGKTAIVEGLAQRIVSNDVPETLSGKELISLDLASLLAGAKFRGEFEDRLKAVLKEVESAAGHFLIFMDELHTLVGAGAAEGSVDAANILKPALARGTLHAIGATTIREYRQYIEKDPALERRFQPVLIDQPSVENAVTILRGLKERYELHHGVRITDDALVAAVQLSTRYIPDRYLPDKAIDLVDEATSSLKMDIDSLPAELDVLRRRSMQIEIELAALKREEGAHVAERRVLLEKELADLKDTSAAAQVKWQAQKDIIKHITTLKEQRDKLRLELESAERNVELEKAAEIKYGQLPKIEAELSEVEKTWSAIPEPDRILRQEVTEEDIARVVSRWTGIPVTRLVSAETQKLAHLEQELGHRIVGQTEAVHEVANAIRRSRSGIAEEGRPVASFMFLGPTGVGKTELAKALSDTLFNDPHALVRIDLSEYQEAHTVARLIGSPPGYVGHEEGGQLTEAVRRKPYAVLLFDEIEKAHRDVFNIFLQILDDGRLTDGKGRVVNFKNTVIIMTSNLGSEIIQAAQKDMKDKLWTKLRQTFRPEFINRIDEIIVFDPLTAPQIRQIVDLQLRGVQTRLERQGITLTVSDAAKDLLAKKGYDPDYGARPLKRAIQQYVLDELSLQIIEGKIPSGSHVTVEVVKDALQISLQ